MCMFSCLMHLDYIRIKVQPLKYFYHFSRLCYAAAMNTLKACGPNGRLRK